MTEAGSGVDTSTGGSATLDPAMTRSPRARRPATPVALVWALGLAIAIAPAPAAATPTVTQDPTASATVTTPTASAVPAWPPATTAPTVSSAATGQVDQGADGGPAAGTEEVIGGQRLGLPGIQVDLPPGTPQPPRVAATAWLVADLDNGEVLAANRAHVGLAPASTLKILTAITLVPDLDPDTVYTATDADAAIEGSKVGLVAGSRYTVKDLVHGLMLGSGNDTANALATLGGGLPEATRRMSEKAAHLQAMDTHVVNTSGLDAPGQVSSAYDLAIFGREALAEPTVARLVRTTRYRFPGKGRTLGPTRSRFEIQNHNRLLRNYPGATGVKNGYTVQARGSFVGSATRGGRSYVAVVLRAKGSTWHMARDLLDWAFLAGRSARPVGVLVPPRSEIAPPEVAPPAQALGVAEGGAPTMRAGSPLNSLVGVIRSAGAGRITWAVAGLVACLSVVLLLRRRRPLRRTAHSRT
ncbi:MAG: D-alanyl-D-alanine carboxypeptidase [Actinomycetales bacterium]|nr:D-alanyl-D-alanine carboxypeptidase [Actinomycetales bacterium]